MANSKTRKKAWIFSGIALAIVAFSGVAFYAKRDPLIAVQTEKVTRRNLIEIVNANGKIQPVTQVKISPEVSGEIIELPVKEGQQVKKGDLLVKIKPDFYLAAKNSAEASHKAALGARSQVEAELAKAEADFTRNEELFKSKLVATNIYEDYRTALAVAKLRVANSIHMS